MDWAPEGEAEPQGRSLCQQPHPSACSRTSGCVTIAIKMVVKVYGREIILRDVNCFHLGLVTGHSSTPTSTT